MQKIIVNKVHIGIGKSFSLFATKKWGGMSSMVICLVKTSLTCHALEARNRNQLQLWHLCRRF